MCALPAIRPTARDNDKATWERRAFIPRSPCVKTAYDAWWVKIVHACIDRRDEKGRAHTAVIGDRVGCMEVHAHVGAVEMTGLRHIKVMPCARNDAGPASEQTDRQSQAW